MNYILLLTVMKTIKKIFYCFLTAGNTWKLWKCFVCQKGLYFRSGSSLLGNLLSLHPSTSFYFEPFKKFKIFNECHHRFNNSEVTDLIEENLGGIYRCEEKILKKIKMSLSCKKTSITVIKTIRIHLNGILPWLHKFPLLKVGKDFF